MYNVDDAVAKIDGYVISVTGAGPLVGEKKLVRLTDVGRTAATAVLLGDDGEPVNPAEDAAGRRGAGGAGAAAGGAGPRRPRRPSSAAAIAILGRSYGLRDRQDRRQLLLTMLLSAHQSSDQLGLLITVGFAAQIFFHVYQNVGMTIALMPITGLPLPLISYGGTFIVMIMFGFGLVNTVWVHRKALP